ncbi:MAG: hypothetical protein A2234_03395 [Elusimicrobia bacterium RIFOXYA2_FULL_58_8]|nr:MAG: hypothetical protein A2285_00145 [Elusimicrobia bacterium RIFOXYA12_FULL_57_11]OGS17172.1 MAG: hypothetical protein A2234_03395 [Elusimicrobia bacterium RIFOXYA2_FULL_58_8]
MTTHYREHLSRLRLRLRPALPADIPAVSAFLIPAMVTALTFIVFLPALKNGFVNWDDIPYLVFNRKNLGLEPEQLKWMFTAFHLGPYQPLTWITFGIDNLVWGMSPFGFHLTNVVLHSLNALLFYLLCKKLLVLTAGPDASLAEQRPYLAAGCAALFFALHPLRVEAVAWITARRDVLSGLFYLLTVLFYLEPRSWAGEKASFWRRQTLPLAAFLLSLLAKGMAITLPIALLILDVYPLKRLSWNPRGGLSRASRQVWLEKIPFFALAAVFGAIGYACQTEALGTPSNPPLAVADRAAQITFALFFYIRKTLLPFALSPLYTVPAGFALPGWPAFLTAAALTAITATAVILRRRWPAGLAAWVYYLATISPVTGIVGIDIRSAADRYSYLPCLGFAVLAGAGLRVCQTAAGPLARTACYSLAFAALTALAGLTWRQEAIWKNPDSLWRHALTTNPRLHLAHYNLGVSLEAQGKTAEAEAHYREALKIDRNVERPNYNLGRILDRQGKQEEAAKHYTEALRINPELFSAHHNLGVLLATQGKTTEAEKHYLAGIRISPGFALTYYQLGLLTAAQGKFDAAEKYYRQAVHLSPDLAQAHNNLGAILATRGEFPQAAWHYRRALKSAPGFAETHNNLGGILATQGKLDEAIVHYREALKLNPGFAGAHYNLSSALHLKGRLEQADRHYRRALELNPAISSWPGNQQGKQQKDPR